MTTETEALTLRALEKGNFVKDVIVALDGVEALDYFFGTGMYTGGDTTVIPQLGADSFVRTLSSFWKPHSSWGCTGWC